MILNDVVTKMLRSILLQRYAFFVICRNVFVFFVSNQGQKGLSFVSNHGQVEALMFQIRGKIVLVLSQIRGKRRFLYLKSWAKEAILKP